MSRSTLRKLERSLSDANTYQEWLSIAHHIDTRNGAKEWQETVSGDGLYSLLKQHVAKIDGFVSEERWHQLMDFLPESLYRAVAELNSHRLYDYALTGPKDVVEAYLSCVETALLALCYVDIEGFSPQGKFNLFSRAEQNFGRPALMLSGGGTFGIYHLGVVKALLEQGLLPEIISGTSMGAIVAGLLAVSDDATLSEVLNTPENRDFKPLKRQSMASMISSKALLDEHTLHQCIVSNIGGFTFEEAFQKTGREVSISIASVRSGQKPRVLNHQTAPNVLISSAAKASCSIPGLFPSTTLKAKNAKGEIEDYLPTERWVDGSFASDIPQQRISRLTNANYFIVSQANPHVLPFVSHREKRGAMAVVKDFALSSAVSQSRTLLKVAQRRLHKEPWRSWLDHGLLVFGQDYLGDINLHPEFPTKWFMKFMKNPDVEEIHFLIRAGERATWPYIKMIDNQTRISRVLRRCVALCKAAAD